MPLGPKTMKTAKLGQKSLIHAIASTRPSSTWTRCNFRDSAMCTTHRRASVSLEARVENPSLTYFHVKQAARSQRVSHVIALPSVLWHNQ
jgi:hypothetical protein